MLQSEHKYTVWNVHNLTSIGRDNVDFVRDIFFQITDLLSFIEMKNICRIRVVSIYLRPTYLFFYGVSVAIPWSDITFEFCPWYSFIYILTKK